jgi:hypothetical protein
MTEKKPFFRLGPRVDKEVEEFRGLLEPPSTFEEGFTWPAFMGSLFVAFLMVPGAIYMNLLVGGVNIAPAAQWTTLILFIEIARRANKTLKKAEMYIIFFLAGMAMFMPFEGVLWNQFFAQSNAAQAYGIAELIPSWFVPTEPGVLAKRSLLHATWIVPLLLVVFTTFMSRLNNTILGYGLFRLASDIEKLPFPMAAPGVQGILALSEEQDEERSSGDGVEMSSNAVNDADKPKSWRWRVFSIGGAIGLVFGFLYIGLPTLTGALLDKPIMIFPIPWIDYTPFTGEFPFMKAVATGVSFDLTNVMVGMIFPYTAVLGSFIGMLMTNALNPILYNAGILRLWMPGDSTQNTMLKNNIDFYMSFTVGISFAIVIVGIFSIVAMLRKNAREKKNKVRGSSAFDQAIPEGRGDIKMPYVIAVYVFTTVMYLFVAHLLIDFHKWPGVFVVMLFFGFVYTPLLSYATARLEGLAGQVVSIPMIREASFILSGYQGVAIWFLPIPMDNYGSATTEYRRAELVGVRFWSQWKAILFLTPIVLVTSLFFANFIWSLGPIPGPQFPYAQQMWEMNAENQCMFYTATMGGYSLFQKTFKPVFILAGFAFGGVALGATSLLGLPVFLMYGLVKGLGQTLPHSILPQFIGALLGKYYFQKKLGLKWRQFVPVVFAGFGCGTGLLTTFCIGVNFLIKSVITLPF